jgi:probable rRNA maturation factor
MLAPPLAQLSVGLVDEADMAALHRRYLGRRGATDVLSFQIDRDRRGRTTAGEVVICVPVARRAAAVRGIALKNELLLYALHGMLHLCGFDDRTEPAFVAMHAKEDELLTRLGVGPVFRLDPAARRSRPRSGVRR